MPDPEERFFYAALGVVAIAVISVIVGVAYMAWFVLHLFR